MSAAKERWGFASVSVVVVVGAISAFLYTHQSDVQKSELGKYLHHLLAQPIFHLGSLPITLAFLLKAFIYVLVLGSLAGITRSLLQNRVLSHTSLDPGQRYAYAKISGYVVFLMGVTIGLQSSGVNLNSLLVLGGAVGIGVGLGLQTLTNNFVSGLVLLFERPIKLGDRVEVGGVFGDVVKISGRSTWVRTNENVVIIVPNSDFVSNTVTNWTANDRSVRFSVPVGVSYSADPERVRQILLDTARAHNDVLPDPAPDVLFLGFGDSSLDFELRVWTITQVQTPKVLASDLYFAIFKALAAEKIEIPFPQRDIHVRSVDLPIPLATMGAK